MPKPSSMLGTGEGRGDDKEPEWEEDDDELLVLIEPHGECFVSASDTVPIIIRYGMRSIWKTKHRFIIVRKEKQIHRPPSSYRDGESTPA